MVAVSDGFFHRWARLCATLRTLNSYSKAFVIGVEVEEEIFGIGLIAGLVSLQHRFEEPRGVADVPARRAHEFRRLDDVIFNLEWRDDLHGSRAHLLVKLRYGDGILP